MRTLALTKVLIQAALADADGIVRGIMAESSAPTPPPCDPARDIGPLSNAPVILDSHNQAWQRLINSAVPKDELALLLEKVFSNQSIADMVDRLQEKHIQTLIDTIDTVRRYAPRLPEDRLVLTSRVPIGIRTLDLAPQIRGECMKLLHGTCAR